MTLKPSAGDAFELEWFKSSYSHQSDGNECIEVATAPDTIRIRDSKNPLGPQLCVRPGTWADFLAYAAGDR
ncbi:DUF397 domain-containing protein [Streptomyces sp. NBC_01456]|uniref:DUF397 domain-containing protein n=1 Tax=unclassified Streptomyces TaxID=2593676 RepID=UPI002E380D7E|nr:MULTISPECIES: DUF397 domain-containing protein [unclassified Streptomyces]